MGPSSRGGTCASVSKATCYLETARMAEGRLPNWVDPTAKGTTAWEETTWDVENENGNVVRGDDSVARCL